jgi:NifU-like protein involved in Fe-S cluster formation
VALAERRFYIAPVTTSPLYNRDILRLASDIPHLGLLADPDAKVERTSTPCGSRVIVGVRMDEAGRVAALGQEVRACALGQASAALMGRHAVGRSAGELAEARDAVADFLAGRRGDFGGWPGMEVLAVARAHKGRHASILLPFEAIAEAAALAAARRLAA